MVQDQWLPGAQERVLKKMNESLKPTDVVRNVDVDKLI